MTAQEIKSLPKEFDFKSNINPYGLIYHAVEKEHHYVVTTDTCEWEYDKHEFRVSLLNGDFVVVGKEVYAKYGQEIIDLQLEKAKREGAREAIKEIAQAFRKHGVTYMLNRLDELEEEYEED